MSFSPREKRLKMNPESWTKPKLARIIDHTLLRPDATPSDIERMCAEGIEFKFASVCVAPVHIKRCRRILEGSEVKVCSIVGFPLGSHTSRTKQVEAELGVEDGAHELDMVMNVGGLVSGDLNAVEEDIARVASVCRGRVLLKVIIEAGLLTDSQKREACKIVAASGADFVKSNTGFGFGGAKVEDISLMREVVGPDFGVKASGGIRSFEQALELVRAGANRIGTSAGVAMVS